jgi:hypothetical protein
MEYCGRAELFRNLQLTVQWSIGRMRRIALGLVLGLSITSAYAAPTAASDPYPQAHVYLIRGFINIFSLGMDQLADKLNQQGIHTTVFNHTLWEEEANEAIAEYKAGKIRTIIIVGHSWGAIATTDMVARLGQYGVPVKLAIGLDPVWRSNAHGNVGRYVNYYISDGLGDPVAKGGQFSGSLDNVDVKNVPNIGHFNIDKNTGLQNKIIAKIHAALGGATHAPPTAQPAKRTSLAPGNAVSR